MPVYFIVVAWLWTAFLFLVKKKTCQTWLFYFSAPQQAIHNLSSQQHSRSCALCPWIFCRLIPWQALSNKIREGQGQNGENEMLSKWDGIHRVFSTHTQVHRNASLKNLGCGGAELLTFLTLYKIFVIFLTLYKKFNTLYFFTLFATGNE